MFGTAVWLTRDGDKIRAENHLEDLVQRYFDLDWFKSQFRAHTQRDYITPEQLEELQQDPAFKPDEPGAPTLIDTKELQELASIAMDIEEMTPLNIGEIPTFAARLERAGLHESAQTVLELAQEASMDGFESVVLGNEQPYHFAFKRGDVRVRFFNTAFVAELDATKLNRDTAGRIIDVFFEMTGANPAKVPPSFGLDLVDFSGDEPKTKSHTFNDMNEFFNALSKFRRTASFIEKLLKFATIFYKRATERT